MTKLLLSLSIIAIGCTNAYSQNLAPDPSFESYTTCPIGVTNHGQALPTTEWTNFAGSPDYYNACNTGYMSVPGNLAGSQAAASGNGYMGMYLYNYSGSRDNKEYIAADLGEGSALVPGRQYRVSMDVSLSEKSAIAANGFGMLFYKDGLPVNYNGAVAATIPATPQANFEYTGPIWDTVNWVTIVDTFTADSAYRHVVIGGFKTRQQMDTVMRIFPTPGFAYSYYYVDNIRIEDLATLAVAEEVGEQAATLYPNPLTERATIRFNNNQQKAYSLVLYNLMGQPVMRQDRITGSEATIHRNNLPSGTYYYQLSTAGQQSMRGNLVIQ